MPSETKMTILEIKATVGSAVGSVLTFVSSEAGIYYFSGLGSGLIISYLIQRYYAQRR